MHAFGACTVPHSGGTHSSHKSDAALYLLPQAVAEAGDVCRAATTFGQPGPVPKEISGGE